MVSTWALYTAAVPYIIVVDVASANVSCSTDEVLPPWLVLCSSDASTSNRPVLSMNKVGERGEMMRKRRRWYNT